MATERWCLCLCHRDVLGDYLEALQRGDQLEAQRLVGVIQYCRPQWAPVDDAMEAAVATGCPCVNNHAPVFGKPPYKPPTKWNPQEDAD